MYSTVHLPETENLYYQDHNLTEFEATVVDVYQNVLQNNKRNLLIIDRSAVYPTSGGQQHDTGIVKIQGIEEEFKLVNAEKVGKVILHVLDRELPEDIKGRKVNIAID